MADLQHTALTSAQVHEPKHVTSNGVSASGRVVTNSSVTPGISEYRKLLSADLDEFDYYLVTVDFDSSLAEDTYLVLPTGGLVTQIQSVINNALTTADNIYTITIDGNSPTPSTLTVTQAGSAPGDVDAVVITSGGEVTAGSVIRLANNGGNGDASVKTQFTVTVRRA